MIDFQSIRHTTTGLECYYLGQRRSGDQVLHRFGVVNPAGETFAYYNEQGQRIDYDSGIGKWVVKKDGHQIIAPLEIVEVTRWIGLRCDSKGEYTIESVSKKERLEHPIFLAKQQHTFRFEVPNE